MRSSTFHDPAPQVRCRGNGSIMKTPFWTFLTVFVLSLALSSNLKAQNLYYSCTGCTSEDIKATSIRFDPAVGSSCLNPDQFFDATLYLGVDVTSKTRYGMYIEFYLEVNGELWDGNPNADVTPIRYTFCVKQDLPQGTYEIEVGEIPGLPAGSTIRLVDVFTAWENQSPNVGGGNGKYFCDLANFPASITCGDVVDKPRCKSYPFLGTTVITSKPTVNVTGPSAVCGSLTGASFTVTGTASSAGINMQLSYSFTGGAPYTTINNFDGSETIAATGPTLTAFLTRIKAGEPNCVGEADAHTITINPPATVEAGPNKDYCTSGSAVSLSGSFGGGASSATWSGGAGTFSNINSPTSTYTPSAGEIAAGSVVLTLTTNDPDGAGPCLPAADNMTINISRAAITDAGEAGPVCAASPAIQLNGSVTGGSTSGSWTTSGTGSFNNASALNAIYTPSAADIAAGTVTLTLTSGDPVGSCPATNDNVVVQIFANPTALTVPDFTICANGTAQLGVNSTPATGSWSGGGGSYAPGPTSANAVYTPTPAEKTAGSVVLTWTTTDPPGPCGSASDNLTITINPVVVTEAGDNRTVCSSSPSVVLAGSITGGATTGEWTGGTGSFVPGRSALNATYTPSPAEITAGTVTLTLVSANPAGPCESTSDAMTITINPAATAEAGEPQTICANQTVQLAGSSGGGASTGAWTGGGGTYSPGPTAGNAVYTPSPAEKVAGTVTLTWTTNDPAGICGTANDQVTITINPLATVEAGNPQTTCVGVKVTLTAQLFGSATGVTWSAPAGSGTFSCPTCTTTDFTPSITGAINVTATTNNPSGPCDAGTDIVVVTANDCGDGFCTYTQGGFGQEGGKDSYLKNEQCIKSTGATMTVGDALAGWGVNGMQISNMNFKNNAADIKLIIDYLPNGGPSKAYTGTKENLLTDGDKNTLLAQTITLGLNLGLNKSLGAYELKNMWLVTSSSDDCGATADGLTTQCFRFNIVSGMDVNGDNKVTVLEVFNLANKALKGEALPAGVTLSGLAGAADAVNNAFDECRVPLRWSETDACGGAYNTKASLNTESFGTTVNAASALGNELTVKAYPNPFKDRVFIRFTSPVSGKATVDIFDMSGRRLETINKGQVVAGRENTVEYTVPTTNRNSIIYRVTVDKYSVNGRLISPGINR